MNTASWLGAVSNALVAEAPKGTFWLPPAASTTAHNTDSLFYFIFYLSLFFFVVIMAAMVAFAVRYRRRKHGEKTADIHGHRNLEIAWSVIPGILLMVIFFWGFTGFMDLAVPPANALDIRVTGQKWVWAFDYPEGINSNELVVPAGKPVRLTMSSKDVIHSFYVPDFRIKRDVLPNRYTVLWFEAPNPGEHNVFCTEYCGAQHSGMLTKVKVLAQADYDAWIASGGGLGQGLSPVELGQKLFQSKGCVACHSVDGKPMVGPSLKDIYGHEVELADGTKVMADDNYIRQSLMDPASQVVKGFAPVMPTFKGMLKDQEVNALIDYLKTLSAEPGAH